MSYDLPRRAPSTGRLALRRRTRRLRPAGRRWNRLGRALHPWRFRGRDVLRTYRRLCHSRRLVLHTPRGRARSMECARGARDVRCLGRRRRAPRALARGHDIEPWRGEPGELYVTAANLGEILLQIIGQRRLFRRARARRQRGESERADRETQDISHGRVYPEDAGRSAGERGQELQFAPPRSRIWPHIDTPKRPARFANSPLASNSSLRSSTSSSSRLSGVAASSACSTAACAQVRPRPHQSRAR